MPDKRMEMKMSGATRKAEKKIEFEKRQEAAYAESHRRADLSMWERIEESDASDDVKDILHRLAGHY
jgi:hypothetical protein